MRPILLIWLIFQWFNSISQDSKHPFQVIFAEKVTVNSGRQIGSMEYLNPKDVIRVDKTGTLSMIHQSGFPLEFAGDTTLSISILDSQIRQIDQRSHPLYNNPILELLFITSPKELQKVLSERTGWVTDRNHNLELFYPPARLVSINEGLHLTWRTSEKGFYTIKISNFYGDSLTTFNCSTNKITIPKSDIDTIIRDSVAVGIISDGIKYSNEFVLRRSDVLISLPYSGQPESATTAICVALIIETAYDPPLEIAEEFYLMATKLSDNLFYKLMLANFKKRWKR